MKKNLFKLPIFLLITALLIPTHLSNAADAGKNETKQNANSALIAKQGTKVIRSSGPIDDGHAPFSTFKIALALMAFDAGIFHTKDTPQWPFKAEYEKNFQSWYTRQKGEEYHWIQDHTPATFMKNSVLWISHIITNELGKEKFQDYVVKLNYGNKDISGTPGQDDGLLNSWLGTSLKISPHEQVVFLEKLCANELKISKDAQARTREIMDREEDWNGWKLSGKTGGGSGRNGWFVGWIEKDGQRIIFAQYLDLEDPNLDLKGVTIQKSIGLTAKEVAKANLLEFWQK